MAAALEPPLSQATHRNLSDRNYEKRKLGSIEVERAVQQALIDGDTTRITAIIDVLTRDFTCSLNANQRKGGLVALAGVGLGLMDATKDHLDKIVPAILKCFGDQEPRVRYYACEALFNIGKVVRSPLLRYFDVVFIGLCKLFADVDVDVKNGAQMLDRLIKDIVADSEDFDVESFIPLLQDHMKGTNPYVRALLVGWIRDLDTIPDIEMLDYLPHFLEGLFDMLSDGNREIRQQAYQALANFLEDIKKVDPEDFDKRVKFGPMIEVLVRQCAVEEKFNRVTAVWWLHQFIKLGRTKLRTMYARLLESILQCISDPEQEIRQEAKATNNDLMLLVQDTEEELEFRELLKAVTAQLPSKHKYTRLAALRWISMLLDKAPDKMLSVIDDVLAALLRTLSDESDDVIKIALEVLARIALDETQFLRVLNDIVNLFAENRRLLETRGSFTIRRLCVLLDAKSIYITLAQILSDEEDLEFASIMIETLNLILLTSEELTDLRDELRSCVTGGRAGAGAGAAAGAGGGGDASGMRRTFSTLYNSWCHNAVATFTLCLLAQAYELGAAVVSKFTESQITVGLLMQVDKLVQLIESPVFLHLRLQLLEPHRASHAALLKSLYGLLMLLPQSRAFNTLRNRLMSITSLHIALEHAPAGRAGAAASAAAGTGAGVRDSEVLDHTRLLQQYDDVQAKHAAHLREVRGTKRLPLRPPAGGSGAKAGAAGGAGAAITGGGGGSGAAGGR